MEAARCWECNAIIENGISCEECKKEVCHSDRDGDCFHKDCPQLRDNEPHKTGRHCPLDVN